MKDFVRLFQLLDRTTKTNDKIEHLKHYFLYASEDDKIRALALFSGRRPPRAVKAGQLQEWSMELASIPPWLFAECYSGVGDLAETIALILPVNQSGSEKSLTEWFEYIYEMQNACDSRKKQLITDAWKMLDPFETFVFNKLLMGSLRIGVSQTLVIKAIASAMNVEPAVIAHRIMGSWDPQHISFKQLVSDENAGDRLSVPYPFYLSYALEDGPESLGDPDEWFIEWKWDGIRGQIIVRNGEIYIWSRGEELITDKFPELMSLKNLLPEGTVLDGEIICFAEGKPLPFNILQTRISRKNLTKKILTEAPVSFIVYDIIEFAGNDIRVSSQSERRNILEKLCMDYEHPNLVLSPLIKFTEWNELKAMHLKAREHAAEGFMLKRKSAMYLSGRKKGDWWKWKTDPLSADAVLVYAQKGHGRRAELFTDYTFAVWDNDKLIPFAKAYSGLTDKEIAEVDRFIRQHTIEKFGPVRTVMPELVFEIGFEGINKSSRHKSGIAVRFPRILRWRRDKTAKDADTLATLQSLLAAYS